VALNKDLIRRRLDLIRNQYLELREMKSLSLEDFVKPRNTAAAESFLRRALEAIFDIGRHILAKKGRTNLAQEYKSIAKGLVQLGVVSGALADDLKEMAGYRNRLVHLYHEITPEELYGIIQDEVDSLKDFILQTLEYLEKL